MGRKLREHLSPQFFARVAVAWIAILSFVRLRYRCATGDRRRTVGDPVVRSTVPVLVL